jgi:MYXO-CTERM domain-containing protein
MDDIAVRRSTLTAVALRVLDPCISHPSSTTEKVFTMKRILSAIALAVAAFTASAGPVTGTLTLNGFSTGALAGKLVQTGEPNVSAGVGALSATFLPVGGTAGFDDIPYTVFCTDLYTSAAPFGTGITYIQDSFPAVAAGTALGKMFTYAFTQGLLNQNGDVQGTTTDSVALQLAVWETLYDTAPGNLSGGNFTAGALYSWDSGQVAAFNSAKTEANSLLAGGAAIGANWATLTAFNDTYASKPLHQSFMSVSILPGSGCELTNSCDVTTVPEPSSLALALIGLVGLTGAARRARKA